MKPQFSFFSQVLRKRRSFSEGTPLGQTLAQRIKQDFGEEILEVDEQVEENERNDMDEAACESDELCSVMSAESLQRMQTAVSHVTNEEDEQVRSRPVNSNRFRKILRIDEPFRVRFDTISTAQAAGASVQSRPYASQEFCCRLLAVTV